VDDAGEQGHGSAGRCAPTDAQPTWLPDDKGKGRQENEECGKHKDLSGCRGRRLTKTAGIIPRPQVE
jgi:hypothetical protein